jgi:hypothetical protein
MNTILSLDHLIYITIGSAFEFGIVWAIARIKTLSKTPTASLAQDSVALIEKLIAAHAANLTAASASAAAVQQVAALTTGTTAPTAANANATVTTTPSA